MSIPDATQIGASWVNKILVMCTKSPLDCDLVKKLAQSAVVDGKVAIGAGDDCRWILFAEPPAP